MISGRQRGYDVIVAGLGGMGSAATYQLARRGKRVLGLERFDIPHTMGSSHGLTRIIRLAYFESPTYVPLLRRAYTLWRELEREVSEELLIVTGSLDIGRPGSQVFEGSLESCLVHDLPHEVIDRTQLTLRFPAISAPAGFRAVLQPDGGFLLSERCIVQYVMRAQTLGAEVRARERILEWSSTSSGGIRVQTERNTYHADRLVLTGGAWTGSLVPGLESHLRPERQVLGWFQPLRPEKYQIGALPVFNFTVDEGHFYGFPVFAVPGVKVGLYHHLREDVDPETMDRDCHPADEQPLRAFLETYFPAAAGPTMALKSCLFTNTRDEHFVIDTLPGHPEVVVGGGFSGHGFKFASVVGEILTDLALAGTTAHGIERFRIDRFDP